MKEGKKFISSTLLCILGGIIYAGGMNLFIIPLNLYSGSFTGIAQILQDLLKSMSFPLLDTSRDYTGVILMLLNLPIVFLTYKDLNRKFFIKTILTIIFTTLAFSLIPVMEKNILDDVLSSCILGGVVAGFGAGLALLAQGSAGGIDILGIYLTKKIKNFSVGKLSIIIGGLVLTYIAISHDIRTVIYSLIFTYIYSFTVDKVHLQNIYINAQVITKKKEAGKRLNAAIDRGITLWTGQGVYSEKEIYVFMMIISKDEIGIVKKIMMEEDPAAFIIFNEGGYAISGNFEKRLV